MLYILMKLGPQPLQSYLLRDFMRQFPMVLKFVKTTRSKGHNELPDCSDVEKSFQKAPSSHKPGFR